MRLILIINFKNELYKKYELNRQQIMIGRSNCNIILPHDDVSPIHLQISIRDGMIYLKDMHSLKGTFANGKKLTEEYIVRKDDIIKVGSFELKFHIEDEVKKIPEINNEIKAKKSIIEVEGGYIPHSFKLVALR